MSASPTFLVTGATGATGGATVRELLQLGRNDGVDVAGLGTRDPISAGRLDSFEKALLARGGNAFLAQHLREVAIDHGNGLFAGTNDIVERITGRRPMTVREFVNKNRSLFAVPE